MTEPRSPLDTALDLLVYVPVGLALTAAEEIPKLAAKGRAQLGGRISMAKVVGQFVVAQGRKEVTRRVSGAPGPGRPVSGRPRAPAPAAPEPPAPRPPTTEPPAAESPTVEPDTREVTFDDLLGGAGPPVGEVDGPGGPASDGQASDGPTSDGQASDGPTSDGQASDGPTSDGGPAPRVTAGARPDPTGLAIPGYDSLAASQVVQRLAGLAADELAAVGAYESSHRARRTILTRVRQLQER